MVLQPGLEPGRLSTRDFKSRAATYYAIGAVFVLYFLLIDSAIFFLCSSDLVFPLFAFPPNDLSPLEFFRRASSYPYFSTYLSQGLFHPPGCWARSIARLSLSVPQYKCLGFEQDPL